MPHLVAEEGPIRGLVVNFEGKEECILGRDPDQAHVVINDPAVSRKHAFFYKTEDGILIKNLSQTNPLLVNDLPIREAHLLKEGDHVKMGNSLFFFSEEEPPKELLQEAPKIETGTQEETLLSNEEATAKVEEPTYDTIFEESYEGEAPISLTIETPLLLKVLSGPNNGAEFGLEFSKSYLIGKDPNISDLIFNDLSVSKKHARLSIDEEGKLFLEDLGSKNGTFVNNGPLDTKKEISSQDIIQVGTTTFVILDKKAAQETIFSPGPLEELVQREEEALAVEKEETPISWKEQIIPYKHLFLGGAIGLVLLVSFVTFFSLFKSHSITVEEPNFTKEISTVLKKHSGAEFSYNPQAESLFLVGHILTKIDHDELLYTLKTLPFINKIEDNLIIDEFVWKSMNDILTENGSWKGIYIHSSTAGKFEVLGFVKNSEEAQKLSEFLNVNFPYVGRLENKVIIEELLAAQIKSYLVAKSLSAVGFQLVNGDIILGGRYSIDDEKLFKDFLKEIEHLPGIRTIKNLAIPTSALAARIDLTKEYTVSGVAKKDKENFSLVINGQIISQGDLLDGMKVTSIQKNMILLEKEGLKYKIDFSTL